MLILRTKTNLDVDYIKLKKKSTSKEVMIKFRKKSTT